MRINPKLSRNRSPRWRFTLLDDRDVELRDLRGVVDSSGEIAARERLGGSASLVLDERGDGIDWMKHRVRFTYDPGIMGVEPWPMGTYVFASPVKRHRAGGRTTYTCKLLTKLSVIDGDPLDEPLSLPAGTPIISTVEALLASTGETRVAVTPSTAVLASPYTLEAGESKLTAINELLQAADYWALKVNLSGMFVIAPYVNPADRDLAWAFEQGARSVHRSEWEHTQDLNAVPNVAIARTTGTDEEPALVGVARNEITDPHNPAYQFSYAARGRWIGRTYDVEASTQDVVDSLAQQRLLGAMDPVSAYDIEHAILPLEGDDLVRFVSSGTDTLGTIQKTSWSGGFDGHMKTRIRANLTVESEED